jgi:hypothetical protein
VLGQNQLKIKSLKNLLWMAFPIDSFFYTKTIEQTIESYNNSLQDILDLPTLNSVDKFSVLKLLNEVAKRYPSGSEYIHGYLRIVINNSSEISDKFNSVDFKPLNNNLENNEFLWVRKISD